MATMGDVSDDGPWIPLEAVASGQGPTGADRLYAVPTDDDFDAFYLREWHSVVGLAVVLTGDRAAAEDLTQEAFTTAYRDWSRIGAYDRPGAFVRRVVANAATSRGRRLVRETRAIHRLGGRRDDMVLPPEVDETWAVVRRLPRRQAQVVALTYLTGLTLAEAAEVMEVGVETAKTHLTRARRSLSRTLAMAAEPTPAPPPPPPTSDSSVPVFDVPPEEPR
jgi:RNA polymerase sigma-70 factor, ECF subfamily